MIGIADEKERPWRERCFALFALGLLRDTTDETRACFLRSLDGTARVDDLPLSALFAIGLTGDTTWGPELANWLATGKAGRFDLSERGRAVALGALGRIGDPAAIPSLWAALADGNSEVQVAAALALGRVVPAADAETRRRFLEWFADSDRPASAAARNLLLLSAARVAAAPEATEAERALVRRAIVAPSEGADRDRPGYAALALGLLGTREGEDSSVAYLLRLRLRLGMPAPEPSPAGRRPWPPHTPGLVPEADAVALGLLGDDRKETVDLLLSVFANRGLPRKLRAMAATALGLIGDPRAAGPVTASLTNREDRDLRVDVATAAGLLPTEGTRDGLLAAFSDPRSSQFVLGSAAMALGRFRAFDAVPRLLEILQPDRANGDYPDLVRALAVCALGRIGSRETADRLARAGEDVTSSTLTLTGASFPALDELLMIF